MGVTQYKVGKSWEEELMDYLIHTDEAYGLRQSDIDSYFEKIDKRSTLQKNEKMI